MNSEPLLVSELRKKNDDLRFKKNVKTFYENKGALPCGCIFCQKINGRNYGFSYGFFFV